MNRAYFYTAGCPVCNDAEKAMMGYLDKDKVDIEIVNFAGDGADRISEAESVGVKSVPALVVGDQVYHINYGASMEDVKNG